MTKKSDGGELHRRPKVEDEVDGDSLQSASGMQRAWWRVDGGRSTALLLDTATSRGDCGELRERGGHGDGRSGRACGDEREEREGEMELGHVQRVGAGALIHP